MKFYKHDIPAWIDNTGNLSHYAYRVYHHIIQLIYLHEGPITLNIRGLAGACNMRPTEVKRALSELEVSKKLYQSVHEGCTKVGQTRCEVELKGVQSVNERRSKTLKNKGSDEVQPPLRLDKTRLDKTIKREGTGVPNTPPEEALPSGVKIGRTLSEVDCVFTGHVARLDAKSMKAIGDSASKLGDCKFEGKVIREAVEWVDEYYHTSETLKAKPAAAWFQFRELAAKKIVELDKLRGSRHTEEPLYECHDY